MNGPKIGIYEVHEYSLSCPTETARSTASGSRSCRDRLHGKSIDRRAKLVHERQHPVHDRPLSVGYGCPAFFFQLEGDITLKVMENGKQKDIKIKEGEIFLLPPKVPHSPQRGVNTVGLVVERKREETEIDSCIWFCESCGNELYKENFSLKNIVTELPVIMNSFYSSVEKRTCGKCNAVMEPPVPVS